MDTPATESALKKNRKWFLIGFTIINLLLSSYFLDIWITPNAASRAITVLTLYEDKSLIIDKYKDFAGDFSVVNGHYYANKAPLSSFFIYPFYLAYKAANLPEMKDTTIKKYPIYIWESTGMLDGRAFLLPKISTLLFMGDILCGIIPFVIALLLTLMAIKNTGTSLSPVLLVMLSFYASFLFAYAGTYTGHLLSGIFALSGYILIKQKKFLLSGLLVGLAIATEFPVGILFPIWALLIFLNEKKISKPLLFTLGIIPGIIIVAIYNYHITGSYTTTPYSYEVHQQKQSSGDIGFYFPKLSSLWGLVFSTYRGLLFYTPAVILMCWYIIRLNYKNPAGLFGSKKGIFLSIIKNYLFITVIAYLVLYSAYYMWWGGWAYGPRYLIPMVLILLYEGVIYLSKVKISLVMKCVFYFITIAGMLCVWMDKSTKIYMLHDFPEDYATMNLDPSQLKLISDYKNPVKGIIIPDFMKHKFNANTLPTLAFDVSPGLSVYLWMVLFILGITGLTLWYNKLYPPDVIKLAKPASGNPVKPQKAKGNSKPKN